LAVDQLAKDYAGKPVVFVEQNVDDPLGDRSSKWWEAYDATGDEGLVALPLAMVSSGHQIAQGLSVSPGPTVEKFYNLYQTTIETELDRPPAAGLEAFSQRVGNRIRVTVWVTNGSDRLLEYWQNQAAVNAIVYEETHVALTDRFVRAAVDTFITTALPAHETAAFRLETPELSDVQWDRLHTVAFVDYRPEGGAFDMLQAAVAGPPDFHVLPTELTLFVDPAVGVLPAARLAFRGPLELEWAVSEDIAWLEVLPTSAGLEVPAELSLVSAQLQPGWQQGDLVVRASDQADLAFTRRVPVRAYVGPVYRVFIPVLAQ
jgi:hypothetical protein